MYLSASAIKDYLDCPQKLEYRLQGKEQQPNVYMARGIAVHETIEDQTIQTSEDAKQAFFLKFAKIVNETSPEFPYRTTFASLVKQSYTMLDYYYNVVNLQEPPIKESEIQFRVDINGVEFVGKIDQIRGNNLYDWKSRTKPVDAITLNADYQFTLYGLAYKKLYGSYPDRMYLGYLYGQRLYEITRSKKDYKYMEDVAGQIIFAAENNVFPRNYGTYTCGFCPYRHLCFNERDEVIHKVDTKQLA